MSSREQRGARGASAVVAAVALALVTAGAAAADNEQIRLTNAGEAAARAAVLTRADMGPAAGWTGGAIKPKRNGSSPCPGFHPKQSDLVLTGDAETDWKHAGLEFDSEAQVLQTPAMVRLDWQRTVLAPQALACMRSTLETQLGSGKSRFVSLKRIGFPRLATYTRAFRIVLAVQTPTAPVPVMFDVVMVGRGRTEITLNVTAPLAAAPVVEAAELRIARLLVARIRQ